MGGESGGGRDGEWEGGLTPLPAALVLVVPGSPRQTSAASPGRVCWSPAQTDTQMEGTSTAPYGLKL